MFLRRGLGIKRLEGWNKDSTLRHIWTLFARLDPYGWHE
jgi:hypothetical protein